MTRIFSAFLMLSAGVGAVYACNPQSPAKNTSATIAGKTVTVDYCAPSVRGRKVFGGSDALQPDNSAWRLGADKATVLHTDADLMIGNVNVPKGDYSLFVDLDTGKWTLVINKQTGQWGIKNDGSANFDPSKNVGTVPLTMSSGGPTEQLAITVSSTGGNKGKLQIAWANMNASTTFTAK